MSGVENILKNDEFHADTVVTKTKFVKQHRKKIMFKRCNKQRKRVWKDC